MELKRQRALSLSDLGKRQHLPREAPLSQEAAAAIQAWLTQCGPGGPATALFPRFVGGGGRPTLQPLSVSAAWRVVRQYVSFVRNHGFLSTFGDSPKRNII
jgi:hypothetical protein